MHRRSSFNPTRNVFNSKWGKATIDGIGKDNRDTPIDQNVIKSSVNRAAYGKPNCWRVSECKK